MCPEVGQRCVLGKVRGVRGCEESKRSKGNESWQVVAEDWKAEEEVQDAELAAEAAEVLSVHLC